MLITIVHIIMALLVIGNIYVLVRAFRASWRSPPVARSYRAPAPDQTLSQEIAELLGVKPTRSCRAPPDERAALREAARLRPIAGDD